VLGQRGPIRAPDQSLLLHGFMQVRDGAGCSCISGCNRGSRKHPLPVPIAVKRLRDSKGDRAFTVVVFMTPFLLLTFKRANKNGELELYPRQYFKSRRFLAVKTNGLDFSSPL
jgi:hypothetical protein